MNTDNKKAQAKLPYWNLRSSTTYTPNNGIKPTPDKQRGRHILFLGGIQKVSKFQIPK